MGKDVYANRNRRDDAAMQATSLHRYAMTNDEILNLTIDGDFGKGTIRAYLKDLLKKVIIEQEGFSGKRPWGNSGWIDQFQIPLVEAGLIHGVVSEYEDDYWELDSADDEETEALLLRLIDHIFEAEQP